MGKGFYFRLPVLSLLQISALTPPSWETKIVDEKVEPLDLTQEADLVGITAMTSTVTRAYEIADHFRARGIKVVMGGMHASSLPDEALQHCDTVVVGEAENLWTTLLQDFEKGRLKPLYRHENGFPSLEHLPSLDWSLYKPKKYLPVHFVETTRGCPLDCEFCAVTTAFGGRYRNRSCQEVVDEVKRLHPFEGRFVLKNCVFFVDDNIISNRAFAREFLTRIADLKIHWFSHASMNIARDPEMLKLCQKSGCAGLFIGFETLSTETLQAVGKKLNKPGEYLDIVNRIHDHGIGIDASFVFGFDTDDLGVFDRTLEFIHKAKLEVPFFSILTPYPGTRLYQRMLSERRILTHDWSWYDTSHVVYRPKPFTTDQLLDGYFHVMKNAFSCRSIVKRLWGTTAWKQFFYPMNFGFNRSVKKLRREELHCDAANDPCGPALLQADGNHGPIQPAK